MLTWLPPPTSWTEISLLVFSVLPVLLVVMVVLPSSPTFTSRQVSAPSPSSCLRWYRRPEPSGRTSTGEEVGEVSREEAGQRVRFTELQSGLVGLLEISSDRSSPRDLTC